LDLISSGFLPRHRFVSLPSLSFQSLFLSFLSLGLYLPPISRLLSHLRLSSSISLVFVLCLSLCLCLFHLDLFPNFSSLSSSISSDLNASSPYLSSLFNHLLLSSNIWLANHPASRLPL
jgi:hypothetical protein